MRHFRIDVVCRLSLQRRLQVTLRVQMGHHTEELPLRRTGRRLLPLGVLGHRASSNRRGGEDLETLVLNLLRFGEVLLVRQEEVRVGLLQLVVKVRKNFAEFLHHFKHVLSG